MMRCRGRRSAITPPTSKNSSSVIELAASTSDKVVAWALGSASTPNASATGPIDDPKTELVRAAKSSKNLRCRRSVRS